MMFAQRVVRQGWPSMARKKWGQHFLTDPRWAQKMVSYFSPLEKFAEIGPGRGALTYELEKYYCDFYVFEIDSELEAFHQDRNYKFYHIDFLQWDFCLNEKQVCHFSLIGNLPYETGTAIVRKIVENATLFEHFVFMLQREVVERICALPESRKYGALSVFVQGQYSVEQLDVIRPRAFTPPPKVDSRLLRANRRHEGQHPLESRYWQFIRRAFQYKRKILKNSLKEYYREDQLAQVYQEMELQPQVRAEQIPVDRWPVLYRKLHGQ